MAHETDLVVIGAGPGGYVAAFQAADLDVETTLIDIRENPGGVCLNVGCIPSKALLHAAEVIDEAAHAKGFGIHFSDPKLDLDQLRNWKQKVVSQLTGGLGQLAKRRGVKFIQGRARFTGDREVSLEESEIATVRFKQAILATGSRPSKLPGLDADSERLWDSTRALEIPEIPESLLVIGGGYIGLELGTVYAALGSTVTVVEMMDSLLPGTDSDLVKPLSKRMGKICKAIHLKTKVASLEEKKEGVEVHFEGEHSGSEIFDRVLVSVGRTPNTEALGLDEIGVRIEDGFITIDSQCRTTRQNIFAIGDVAGQPMLAHKAMREGKVAAEVAAGKRSEFDNLAIPAVVFTNPEVAWSGLMENEAKKQGIDYEVAKFPWGASGRALTLDRTEGLTKMLFDPSTGRILGVGIVGPRAGELIAEGTLAIEMAAVAEDLALTIHTHPTLSETMGEVAEIFLGHATHIFKKK